MGIFDVIGDYDATTGIYGCEDVDMSWRARLAGFRVVYNPNSVGAHGYHTTVKKLPSSTVLFNSQKAHIRMLIKNFGLLNLVTFLPIAFVVSLGDITFFPEARYAKLRAWTWNVKNLKGTLSERAKVQGIRRVKDSDIERYFSHDLTKIVLAKLKLFFGNAR
jgi:GT2 family glycosyltransferase